MRINITFQQGEEIIKAYSLLDMAGLITMPNETYRYYTRDENDKVVEQVFENMCLFRMDYPERGYVDYAIAHKLLDDYTKEWERSTTSVTVLLKEGLAFHEIVTGVFVLTE